MYLRDDGWSCSWEGEPKISPYDLEAAQLTLIRYILDTDSEPNLFSYEIVRVKNSIQAILDKDTECSCSVLYSNCLKHKDMLKKYQYDRPQRRQMRLALTQHKQTTNV
jgi:hypothetical protein